MEMYLYDNFVNTIRHTSIKGDGGTELFVEMIDFIKSTKDEEFLQKIKDEVYSWLVIGRTSYCNMALGIILTLKWTEFKEDILSLKNKVDRSLINDLGTSITFSIKNTLEGLEEYPH